MSSLIKSSILTFFTQNIVFIVNLATSVVIARLLGPSGKGTYALITLIPSMLTMLAILGMEESNVYFTANKKWDMNQVVSNSISCAFCFSAVVILLFWFISKTHFYNAFIESNGINNVYVWAVVMILPFALIKRYLIQVLRGREQIAKYNLLLLSGASFFLVFIILFLLVLRKGVAGAILSYILRAISIMGLAVWVVREVSPIRFDFNLGLFKASVRYGSKVYLGRLAQFFNYRLDMFIAAYFLNTSAVGYYSLAVGLVEKVWMIPSAIRVGLFPRIARIKLDEADKLTPLACRYTFLLLFLTLLSLGVAGKPIIRFLYGEAYLPSFRPLIILLPGILVFGLCKVIMTDCLGRGKSEVGTIAAAISLVMNIPLNLIFIPKWGISGAAFSTTISYILASGVIIAIFLKYSGSKLSELLCIKPNDIKMIYRYCSLKIMRD